MMDWMPAIVLTSKLCPTGVESTVYALLAGFQNFGASVASALGVLALDIGGIKTPAKNLCSPDNLHNFDNLTWLILFSHVLLPLLTIPLTFWLIPQYVCGRVRYKLWVSLSASQSYDGQSVRRGVWRTCKNRPWSAYPVRKTNAAGWAGLFVL